MTPLEISERVMARIRLLGVRQVRFWHGMLLTYPMPAPRGYGTRGLLIGVYSPNTPPEYLADDLIDVFSRVSDTKALR